MYKNIFPGLITEPLVHDALLLIHVSFTFISQPGRAQIWLTTDATMQNIDQRTVAQIQNEVMQWTYVTFNLNNNLCGPPPIQQINAIQRNIKRPRSGDVSHYFFLELMGVHFIFA